MIGRDYCRMMARYNAWQNRQLVSLLEQQEPQELTRDRKAFFGSILGTLNHVLWGDHIWMSRFDGGSAPEAGTAPGTDLSATLSGWETERTWMDGRISLWAAALDTDDFGGDLRWYSGTVGKEVARPLAECVVHMFNHQTHHRGQVHAMLTAAGSPAPVSDLVFMPEVGS